MAARVGSGRRGKRDGDARAAAMNRPFAVCAVRSGVDALAFTDSHARSDLDLSAPYGPRSDVSVAGSCYVLRQNNAVRFVVRGDRARSPVVQTMANTELLTPKGICASEDGRYLFVCDSGHHKIKFAALPARSALVTPEEQLSGAEMFVFAGNGRKAWRDGPVLDASFDSPAGVCQCADGTLVVADTGNNCIRRIVRSAKGALVVRTIAGGVASYQVSGQERVAAEGSSPDGLRHLLKRSAGYRDGRRALFRSPSSVVEGAFGELLVADTMNNCIRGLLPPSDGASPWIVSTVCGVADGGHVDGSCEVAAFRQPMGLCVGPRGTFFVSDRGNRCVRQVGGGLAQHSGRRSDCLSYLWVRTIEVGVVPRSVLEASAATMEECAVEQLGCPLGVLYLNGEGRRSPRSSPASERGSSGNTATLVVCDGGNNVIEFLSFDSAVHGVVAGPVTTPSLSSPQLRSRGSTTMDAASPSSSPIRSECSSVFEKASSAPSSVVKTLDPAVDCCESASESGDLSSNQLTEEPKPCACGNADKCEQLRVANAALLRENARLKQLLHRTFAEIQVVNAKFETRSPRRLSTRTAQR